MKLIFALLFCIFILNASEYNIKLVKVSSNIQCHIGKFDPPNKKNKADVTNVCYVDIGDSLVVIEPGSTYNFAKEFVNTIQKQTNKKVSAVIATNYHDDRIYGASYYRSIGIDFIGHKSMINDIKINTAKYERLPNILSKKVFENTKLVYPNILVEDGYIIKGSKCNIKILKFSKVSDSPSDIIVHVPSDKFIFVGNIISTNRMMRYHYDSNIDGWLNTLAKISEMDLDYIVPGHGSNFSPTSYKNMVKYFEKLKKVKIMYENDIQIEGIHLDFSEYKNRIHYKDLVNRNISEYYNQLEWQ